MKIPRKLKKKFKALILCPGWKMKNIHNMRVEKDCRHAAKMITIGRLSVVRYDLLWIFIFAVILSSCAPLNLTCADYAAGKGSHNRQHSNAYKRHFAPHTNFIKSNPMPRI